jgi:hypothetical protein
MSIFAEVTARSLSFQRRYEVFGETAGAGYARPVTADWGLGRYERTAAQLAPASDVVVERAAPRPSSACSTSVADGQRRPLLAAARGAAVTGVDPAARLLDVARERAIEHGLDIVFAPGEAAALPVRAARSTSWCRCSA